VQPGQVECRNETRLTSAVNADARITKIKKATSLAKPTRQGRRGSRPDLMGSVMKNAPDDVAGPSDPASCSARTGSPRFSASARKALCELVLPFARTDSSGNAYGATFEARRSGELFVYVNDSVIGIPGYFGLLLPKQQGEGRPDGRTIERSIETGLRLPKHALEIVSTCLK